MWGIGRGLVSGPIFDADHSVTKWRGQIDTLRTTLVQMWHEVIEVGDEATRADPVERWPSVA